MALTVIQAGAGLQLINESGTVTAPLTIPSGVTLRSDVPPRFFVFNHYVVLVNTPSQPLTIDATGTVRLLTPKPPRFAPTLSGVAGGTLTGRFSAKYTFVTLDSLGNLISESDFSPIGGPVSITSNYLKAAGLDLSPDTVTGRRIYRTTDQGAVYFQWIDLDGNVQTSVQDDLADAALSLIGAPTLGTPPRLTAINAFRGRLFGVGDLDIDNVRYTEAGIQYAWPEDNIIQIPPVGGDAFGVVALIGRRDALGVGRRNALVQITGSGTEDVASGNIDFDVVILSQELGVESQETVKVFRDTGFFLWKDGVYSWGSDGISCVSDGANGKGMVRQWFTTDDYFNRDRFPYAFAHLDINQAKYRLFLSSPGATVIDRWVEFDINERTWWGPHKTDAFTPTCAFNMQNDADRDIPVIGSSAASIYQEQSTRTDGTATAINMDAVGKRHALGDPDENKYFGEISLLQKARTTGELKVVTKTGELNATVAKNQYATMTKNRVRLGRLGQGKHAQVELINAEVGVDPEIYGYEVDPVNLLGRR